MTKEKMLKSIKEQLAEENVSDKISEFFLILEDENDNSFVSAAMCSDRQLLRFLARGVKTLARKANKPIVEAGMDVVGLAVMRQRLEQVVKGER